MPDTVQHAVTGHNSLWCWIWTSPAMCTSYVLTLSWFELIRMMQKVAKKCEDCRFGLIFLQEMSVKFIAKTVTQISNAPDWPLYHNNLWPSFISNLLLSTRYRRWFLLAPWFCKPVASLMKTQQPLSTWMERAHLYCQIGGL